MSKSKGNVVTVKGRFVGGGLFTPRSIEEGKAPKHSACIVLNEGEEEKVQAIVDAAVNDKWGKKVPKNLQDWGVRDGDDPEFDASFEKKFINPGSTEKYPPKTLIKRDGALHVVTEEDGVIYPGCYVAVSVSSYAYEGNPKRKIKPGVTLTLRAVMFMKDGDHLGNAVDAESEFEEFDSDDSADEDDDLYD